MTKLHRIARLLSPVLTFVPFALMLLVHWWFGLSDAFMAKSAPGERFWPMYNPIMVLAFYLGLGGFVALIVWNNLVLRSWALADGPHLIATSMVRTLAWVAVLTFLGMVLVLGYVAFIAWS